MKKAISIICRTPNDIQINFYSQLKHKYDIYFICDDPIYKLNSNVEFIHISDREAISANYYNSTTNTIYHKKVTSWDKALYYFCKLDTSYDFVWFIEDDVFIPTLQTLPNIDEKYHEADDLLVASHNTYSDDPNWSHWYDKSTTIKMFKSMVCATRVSNQLLSKINLFVEKNEKLMFIEVLFNTIAYWNDLNVHVIPELNTITWMDTFELQSIKKENLYHPIKSISTQLEWYTQISSPQHSSLLS